MDSLIIYSCYCDNLREAGFFNILSRYSCKTQNHLFIIWCFNGKLLTLSQYLQCGKSKYSFLASLLLKRRILSLFQIVARKGVSFTSPTTYKPLKSSQHPTTFPSHKIEIATQG